jgi:hypothetical protein
MYSGQCTGGLKSGRMGVANLRTYAFNVVPESFYAVASENEPKLERPETTAKGEMPVAVINDQTYKRRMSILQFDSTYSRFQGKSRYRSHLPWS